MFELYMSRINKDFPPLWQRPKWGVRTLQDDLWFDKVPIGESTLGKFMKVLSNDAKLSDSYSNHSIRKTCIETLTEHGIEARHIMSISSLKSESTIKEYTSKCPEMKKKEMYNILSTAIQNNNK